MEYGDLRADKAISFRKETNKIQRPVAREIQKYCTDMLSHIQSLSLVQRPTTTYIRLTKNAKGNRKEYGPQVFLDALFRLGRMQDIQLNSHKQFAIGVCNCTAQINISFNNKVLTKEKRINSRIKIRFGMGGRVPVSFTST